MFKIGISLRNVDNETTKVLLLKFMDKIFERVPLERALQESLRETKPLVFRSCALCRLCSLWAPQLISERE
jgi:hypothetical protein